MDIEKVYDRTHKNTVGFGEVAFDRNDPSTVGWFTIDALRSALDIYQEKTTADGVYLQLGVASYSEDSDLTGHDSLLFLSQENDSNVGAICCPRLPETEIVTPEANSISAKATD